MMTPGDFFRTILALVAWGKKTESAAAKVELYYIWDYTSYLPRILTI